MTHNFSVTLRNELIRLAKCLPILLKKKTALPWSDNAELDLQVYPSCRLSFLPWIAKKKKKKKQVKHVKQNN